MEKRRDCGRWGFVGGAVEESLEGALQRETLEETGLVVTDEELFAVFPGPSRVVRYPDGNVVRLMTFVYRTEIEDFGTLHRGEESEELRFFGREELSDLDVIETSQPILAAYLDPPSKPFLKRAKPKTGRTHGASTGGEQRPSAGRSPAVWASRAREDAVRTKRMSRRRGW